MFQEELEDQFQMTERKLNELLILAENLDNNYQKLLNDLSLTEEKISQFVDNPKNFSEEEWEELELEKQKMQTMLDMQLSQIQDPKKVKKKYTQRKRVKSNWIYVH